MLGWLPGKRRCDARVDHVFRDVHAEQREHVPHDEWFGERELVRELQRFVFAHAWAVLILAVVVITSIVIDKYWLISLVRQDKPQDDRKRKRQEARNA